MVKVDKQIEFLINNIISELKKVYPDLNVFLYYNSSFDGCELAIERFKYGYDDEFKRKLYGMLEESIYSKGLYVYVYFTNDLLKVRDEFGIGKTVFKHEEEIDCETRLNRIKEEVQLIYAEKPDAKLSYQIALSPYRAVLVETKTLSVEVENKLESEGEIKNEPNGHKLEIINK